MGIIQIAAHSIHPRYLRPESVVVDLGANHGQFLNEVLGRFHCRCVGVEGNSTLASHLAENSKAQILHAVVGDGDGTATFSITENDQCSTILNGPAVSSVIGREEVRMLSLQSLFAELNLDRVDVLKMDIEGAEIGALAACPDAILRRIGQLCVEFHDSLGITSFEEIRKTASRLRGLGFHWIRGTFTNYEDNLFINSALCPCTQLDLFYNRAFARYWNGLIRLSKREWHSHRETRASAGNLRRRTRAF
jgi:FkbM family methyltransferase